MESYSFKFSYSNGKNGVTNGSVEIFRYITIVITITAVCISHKIGKSALADIYISCLRAYST